MEDHMVSVRIATEERKLEEADERWIQQQIVRRRAEGEQVCARVMIHEGGANLTVATPTCATQGGGGRAPNAVESAVFELWDRLGLNDPNFAPGGLIAFLKQVVRLLGIR
jgi:hypothetical protein